MTPQVNLSFLRYLDDFRGMELDSGSEHEPAHGLRESPRIGPYPTAVEVEEALWCQTWSRAWSWAKTVAMEVRLSAQPWAEVWTRGKAKAREEVEAKGRAGWTAKTLPRSWMDAHMAAKAKAEAEALALVGVWLWAQSEARARGENLPAALADPSAIRDTLSDHHRRGYVRHLWYNSRETRDEYSCLVQFITPITRLPPELLHQIFLIIIDETSGPPLALILGCKEWHAIVTSIWGSLNLGTTTPMNAVASKLKRNQWLLDIVVDTNSDRGDFTPSDGAFEAIFAAMEASSRWRSLVVESFPAQADLPKDLVKRCLQQSSNATMSRFTTLKIMSACKPSPLLDRLLHILGTGTTASSELTMMEINSANVISFLAPAYPSIFHSVNVLSLDTPGIPNPVDLLPHLHQLETFNASHISFPTYNNDVDLPFVHTLRHLSLRASSIQWMSGRTFHVLEDCTIFFPLHRHVLHTFSTTLPNCKHLAFQGYPLEILGGVLAPKLAHLSVSYSNSFSRQGSQQLDCLSRRVLGERRLSPQILHISIEATNQAWALALGVMSDLTELVIHNTRPSSLGAKVFQSLTIQPDHARNLSAPLCPLLRRFGLKYDRWLRPNEQFVLIPVFVSIIRSRQRSNYSLESFSLWTRSDQNDPLELIERSEISYKGFQRLAKEIGIGENFIGSYIYGVDKTDSEAFWGVLPRLLELQASCTEAGVLRPTSSLISNCGAPYDD